MKTITAIAGLTGLASATGWLDYGSFSCPSNTDNQCNDQQKSGFDWGSLATGDFSSYGQFSFEGFSCANSFGKRDSLAKRTSGFQDKCITGSVSSNGGPKISCGSQSSGFSITEYQISVSEDVDLEFHYSMDDGSICKHTSSCKSGGSVVQNSQCGGAKQVSFQLPSGSKSSGCEIGIHSIGFDCSSASSPSPKTSSTPAPATKSSSSPAKTTPTSPPVYSQSKSSSQAESKSEASSSSSVKTSPSSPPVYSQSKSSSQAESKSEASSSSSMKTPPSSAPSVPVYGNTTTPAVSKSTPPSAETKSSKSESTPAGSTPSSSVPSANCPGVLPKCLNTWLYKTSCKDNSDYTCFCKESDFTASVIDCVSAWGADTTEIQAALTYLVGLCAVYVPQNPGLITNCPTSIPIGPKTSPPAGAGGVTSTTVVVATTVTTCPAGQTITPPSGKPTVLSTPLTSTIYITSTKTICTKCEETGKPSSTAPAAVTQPASVPYTTVVVMTSVTVPCTYSTGVSAGFPIPSSSTVTTVSTSAVVPQVQLTTGTGSSAAVGLGYGSPTAAPQVAATTPAAGKATATATATKTGFGTTYVPKPSNATAPVPFTGAASSNQGSVIGAVAIGALALLAL